MSVILGYIDLIQRAKAAEKTRLIETLVADGRHDVLHTIRLALDPFMSCDQLKIAEIVDDDGDPGTLTFMQFQELCVALRSRALRGEAARHAIRRAAMQCHAPTWNGVFRKVLMRELRPMTVSAFNAALAGLGDDGDRYRVPLFQPQSARDSDKLPTSGLRFVEPKLPGMRLLCILEKGARFHAADGKVVHHAEIEASLHDLAARLPAPIMLDGVLRDDTFYMFDLLPLTDFQNGMCHKAQQDRRAILESLQKFGAFDTRYVQVLPQVAIDFGANDAIQRLAETTARFTADGCSKIIIKKPEAGYGGKRASGWTIHPI